MNIRETLKKEWFVLVLLVTPFFISFYLWNQLPEIVPIHFNIAGEADDFGPKWMTAFMLPAIALFTYIMLVVLPGIDPKKRIQSAQKPIAAIRIISSVFMIGVYAIIMAVTLGYEVDLGLYIRIATGAMILIVGNYLNSVKPNYFIGIRTPWTLENPEVWKRTHRFSSKLWIIGGLLLIALPFIPALSNSELVMIALVILLAGIPFLHSYIIFNKLHSNNQESK